MKKLAKSLLAIVLAVMMVVSLGACNRDPNEVGGETIITSKTQLYVSNFNGGYGEEWLQKLKARFEEEYKDTSFEEGKTGVQVLIDNAKDTGSVISTTISGSRNQVFFTEGVYYYDFVNQGLVADITDIVTEDLGKFGEAGVTIEDKFLPQQKGFYKTTAGKYFGVPHYSAYYGIMYDVDLFEEKRFYFAADNKVDAATTPYNTAINNGNNGFIFERDDVRSNGPDGKPGTFDDGLPATYEEFFILCDYIQGAGCTPICWTGEHRQGYVQWFCQALAVDYEGLEQMLINYNFTGTAKNLVKSIGADGTVTFEQPKAITNANGYEFYKSAGRYYALDFYQKLTSNTSYYHSKSFNATQSHMMAQQEFLFSKPEAVSPIAMLHEGIWWENEAKDAFADIAAQFGDEYGRNSRRIGMMPLPKATKDKVGETFTVLDTHNSLGFVNANCEPDELALAKLFLQYANTNESIVEYTVTTNTPKALQYTMNETDLAKMSYFGRSVWNIRENCDIVYPFSTNPIFINNQQALSYNSMFESTINGTTYNQIADDLRGTRADRKTSKDFFMGIVAKYNKSWWEASFSKWFN